LTSLPKGSELGVICPAVVDVSPGSQISGVTKSYQQEHKMDYEKAKAKLLRAGAEMTLVYDQHIRGC
jgi:hypothetical protein